MPSCCGRSTSAIEEARSYCRPFKAKKNLGALPASAALSGAKAEVYSSTNSYIPCPALLSLPRLTSSSHTTCGN